LVSLSGDVIHTTLKGKMQYQWTDAKGKTYSRASPFTAFFPLVHLRVAGGAEMGCPPGTERGAAGSTTLPLDRRQYRLALPKSWQVKIAPGQSKALTLALRATKSSNHKFNIVVRLADGREVVSPLVSLS